MRKRDKQRRKRRQMAQWQLPAEGLRNSFAPLKVLDEEQLELIHDASMRILERIGLEILSPSVLKLLKRHGARVNHDNNRVYMDREMVLEKLATAPKEFTLHARNPARNVRIGGNHISFSPVASAPNCSDLDQGRRSGRFEDYCNLLRLTQSFDILNFLTGYPVEPIDLPAASRHLDAYHALISLTDRPWGVYCLGGGRVRDGLEMIRIARGIDRDQLRQQPSILTVVNTNSPLRVDKDMVEGLVEMAAAGQPVIVTPFTLAGAMSPITLAGALAQQNAEALGVMVITQMVNPGVPVIYGGFTSNVDMKTGSPAFGTPEYARATIAGGQLARRYRVPYRSSNTNASSSVDAQAVWESEMSLWSATMGHANIIKHAAGWLEGGLCASFEKFILDIEMLQVMAETLQPIEVTEETLALDTIREVGPGGHFFGTVHTMERYESAFHPPLVADWRNFETWQDSGSRNATERANSVWKQVLENYQEPPLDTAIREELEAYVDKRRGELI